MAPKQWRRTVDRMSAWTEAHEFSRAEIGWLAVAVAVVGIVAVGLAGVCEDVIRHNGLSSTDPSRLMFVIDHRTAWLDRAATAASALGSAPLLAALAIAVAVGLYRLGQPIVVAVAPGLSLGVAAVVAEALKIGVGRARPDKALQLVAETAPSFPSGHSTDSAAFYLAVGLVVAVFVVTRWWLRIACVIVATAVAATIGLSRLVLGVHWPSDVIAGVLIGTGVAVVCVAGCYLFRKSASESVSHAPAPTLVRVALHTRTETRRHGLAIATA